MISDKIKPYDIYEYYEYTKNHIYKEAREIYPKQIWEFYGAIWTDKGLIYIARMNIKGDLELL